MGLLSLLHVSITGSCFELIGHELVLSLSVAVPWCFLQDSQGDPTAFLDDGVVFHTRPCGCSHAIAGRSPPVPGDFLV